MGEHIVQRVACRCMANGVMYACFLAMKTAVARDTGINGHLHRHRHRHRHRHTHTHTHTHHASRITHHPSPTTHHPPPTTPHPPRAKPRPRARVARIAIAAPIAEPIAEPIGGAICMEIGSEISPSSGHAHPNRTPFASTPSTRPRSGRSAPAPPMGERIRRFARRKGPRCTADVMPAQVWPAPGDILGGFARELARAFVAHAESRAPCPHPTPHPKASCRRCSDTPNFAVSNKRSLSA